MSNYHNSLKDIKERIDKGEDVKNRLEYNPDFKMLNYQKYIPIKIEKKIEIPVVDMHKIIQFSTLGKKLGKSTKEIKTKNIDLPFITSQSYEYKKYDYKNPYGIIKNMAYNEAYINERFDKKKYLLENQLHSDSLPQIETYDNIVKDKFERIKSTRQKRNEIIAKKQIDGLLDYREIKRKKIEDDINNKWEKLIEKLDNEKENSYL